MARRAPVDRVSADDLMSLVAERGSLPLQVAAVLTLDVTAGLDVAEALRELGRRAAGVPRLTQRLEAVPLGCGRPIWVDDPGFTAANHVRAVPCPGPGGERAVLDLAAALVTSALPRDRPLWTAVLVTGVADHEAALIVVFHHVLADGIGGLAVLAVLVDGARAGVVPAARPRASVRELLVDAWRERLRAVARLPAELRRLAAGMAELRPALGRLERTSLTRATGPRRRFASIRFDRQRMRLAAHPAHATVNDVVLTAVGGALRRLLASRGESVDRFVISVPFSSRRRASGEELGNRSGVIPIVVPASGNPAARLAAVAAATRAAKLSPPGASTALLGPLFRLLARLGLYERFIDRQRMIHTFVSTLRGPDEPVSLFGCPVDAIAPLSVAGGNVTVSFAVLSYAGSVNITVIVDPDCCPDVAVLEGALAAELEALAPHA